MFSRYLETVLPEDRERTRLVHDQLAQETPEAALMVLRSSFGGYLELADGLLRLNRIPHRLYGALQSTVTREVGRNAYFNPPAALEFRRSSTASARPRCWRPCTPSRARPPTGWWP